MRTGSLGWRIIAIVQRIHIIHEEGQAGLTLVDRHVAIRMVEELTPVKTNGTDEVFAYACHKYFDEVVFIENRAKAIGFVAEALSISDGDLPRQHTKLAKATEGVL